LEKRAARYESFAVVMFDVHPIADNFIHWSVLNIPASVQELTEGASGHFTDGSVELNSYYGVEPPPLFWRSSVSFGYLCA
jgi:hypothetical protein